MNQIPQPTETELVLLAWAEEDEVKLLVKHLNAPLARLRLQLKSVQGLDDCGRAMAEQNVAWLVMGTDLPAEYGKVDLRSTEETNARIGQWLTQYGGLRVVRVTHLGLDLSGSGWRWHPRVSPVPQGHVAEMCHHILCAIRAGKKGCAYVPPTVLEIGVRIWQGRVWVQTRDVHPGPFRNRVLKLGLSLKGPVGDPVEIARGFREFCAEAGRDRVQTGLGYKLRRLCTAMDSKPFAQLWDDKLAFDKAIASVQETGATQVGPFPVHVHFLVEKPEILNLPLDLMLLDRTNRSHMLGRHFPVVWRLACKHVNCRNDWERHENNPIDYAGLRAGFSSCADSVPSPNPRKWLPRAEVASSVRCILRSVGRAADDPSEICLVGDPLEFFKNWGRGYHALYLLTHGSHDTSDADKAGIALGAFVDGHTQNVTAYDLQCCWPGGETGPAFAFFNCCELAQVAKLRLARNSFTTGFVAALVGSGTCREVVANRWSVELHSAQTLAQDFFDHCPVTVGTRAIALMRARRVASDKHKDDGLHSWLAPILLLAVEADSSQTELRRPVVIPRTVRKATSHLPAR